MTNRAKSSIFRKVTLPTQFDLDVEFTASAAPKFVLAIGRDELSAEANEALRLETWDDELVVVQGKVFEPVMTIGKGQQVVRLRVAYDGETNRLRVSDANGRSLVQVEGIRATTGESGIYIRNRGKDLTVRRLVIRLILQDM